MVKEEMLSCFDCEYCITVDHAKRCFHTNSVEYKNFCTKNENSANFCKYYKIKKNKRKTCRECVHCIINPNVFSGVPVCTKSKSQEFNNPHIFDLSSANECIYFTNKENKMEELKVTKEKVLKASKNCPQAKEVLKELFPEVFEEQFKDFDICKSGNDLRLAWNGRFYSSCGEDRASYDEANFLNYKFIGNLEDMDGCFKFAEHFILMLKAKK
jgi:hypothetical protein